MRLTASPQWVILAYFEGNDLYIPFDTHLNQRGHNLAAQTIASSIEDMLAITASKKERKSQR